MTIAQIQSLSLTDCLDRILSRLNMQEPSDAQIAEEFEKYKSELMAVEEARLANLKARFEALSDVGLLQAAGIQNPAKHFQDAVLAAEAAQAESEMQALEQAYAQSSAGLAQAQINAEALAYLAATDWMVLREADSGQPVPSEIKQARAEARARIIR